MTSDADVILAVRDRDLKAVEDYLSAGAAVDVMDENGTTALGLAAANADTPMVELMLFHGADPNRRSRGGFTSLMHAADAGTLGATSALVHKSAHLWLIDDQGRSALDIARAWLGVQPEEELRRRLGVSAADVVTVERAAAPEDGVGSAEVVRVTTPNGRAVVQTGHAAIATELEQAVGIRLSFEELMAGVVISAARALGLRLDPRADQPLMRAFLSIPEGRIVEVPGPGTFCVGGRENGLTRCVSPWPDESDLQRGRRAACCPG